MASSRSSSEVLAPRARRRAERRAADRARRKKSVRYAMARRRRRRLLAVVVVGTAMVVGGQALARWWSRSPLPEERPPAAYRVVYEIDELESTTRTEERLVRRPYDSRVESRRDGELLLGTITTDEGIWQYARDTTDGDGWRKIEDGPHRASDDFRPLEVLRRQVAEGDAEFRGTSTVAGTKCWVVRTGGPLGDQLKPVSEDEHADLCVAESGIVLRERWTLNGKVARRTTARILDLSPALGAEDFEPDAELPPFGEDAPGLPVVRPMSPSERAELPMRLDPPAGFEFDGATSRQVNLQGMSSLTYVERYVNDFELLEVEQGTRSSSSEPDGTRVNLGEIGFGYLEMRLSTSTLTVPVLESHYVRLRGVDIDLLQTAGRRLRIARGQGGLG